MARVVDSPNARRADLAAIHMAKKALGWDEDTYRDIMFTVCRDRSSGALDYAGRKRFLAHLQACQAANGQARQRPPLAPRELLIWSLWQQLADAKLVNDRSMAGLQAWVKRQTGVEMLAWLDGRQLDQVIEAAKGWLARTPKD